MTLGAGRRPVLTAFVLLSTLVVSLAAQLDPALMHRLERSLPGLRSGEWWRAVSAVWVQPDGWAQLVFNLLGIALLGVAAERHVRRASWAAVYLLGGVGGGLLYLVWHPADTGGGSSAGVAALIGLVSVLRLRAPAADGLDRVAQLYAVFFAAYLTALDLGGVLAGSAVGSLTLAVALTAWLRRVDPHVVTRVVAAVVVVGGVAMLLARDDHGVGILVGVAAGVAQRVISAATSPAATGSNRIV